MIPLRVHGAGQTPTGGGEPPDDEDPDPQVCALRARFAATSKAAEQRDRQEDLPRRLLPLVIAATVVIWGIFALSFLPPWPLSVWLRHFASAQNCRSAYAVDLAPARRGEPGYWPWLDRDHDGIACEWRPR